MLEYALVTQLKSVCTQLVTIFSVLLFLQYCPYCEPHITFIGICKRNPFISPTCTQFCVWSNLGQKKNKCTWQCGCLLCLGLVLYPPPKFIMGSFRSRFNSYKCLTFCKPLNTSCKSNRSLSHHLILEADIVKGTKIIQVQDPNI